jgi:hypothetical protein
VAGGSLQFGWIVGNVLVGFRGRFALRQEQRRKNSREQEGGGSQGKDGAHGGRDEVKLQTVQSNDFVEADALKILNFYEK